LVVREKSNIFSIALAHLDNKAKRVEFTSTFFAFDSYQTKLINITPLNLFPFSPVSNFYCGGARKSLAPIQRPYPVSSSQRPLTLPPNLQIY
jgi:hypothetical protein